MEVKECDVIVVFACAAACVFRSCAQMMVNRSAVQTDEGAGQGEMGGLVMGGTAEFIVLKEDRKRKRNMILTIRGVILVRTRL